MAVEPGNNGPYTTSERAESDKNINLKPARYIRVSRDTVTSNVMQEFELLKKFAGYTFSSSLHETATLDDLNYEYMREYLIATGAGKDIRELSKKDMAKSLGLISESEFGGIRAKNFATLMFADRKYINPEIKDMFFSLHLIESYGSGVRRAKNALQQNGSKPVSIFQIMIQTIIQMQLFILMKNIRQFMIKKSEIINRGFKMMPLN